jgi:mono/diheme cytochrome c family protein
MAREILGWIAIACAALACSSTGRLAAVAPAPSAVPVAVPSEHRALLDRYCVTCHNQRLATAQLSLDTLDVEHISGESAATWEKVVRKLRARQMPPAGRPRPDAAATEAIVTYLEEQLDGLAAATPNPGRRPAFHRLNRAEYTNAIRDLLAIDIDAASWLPADDAGHGFDNVADMLAVSPRLVEGYLSAANKISRQAIGDPAARTVIETYHVSRRLVQSDRVSDDLPVGTRGGIAVQHVFPVDGDYVLKVRLQRNKDNYIKGLGEPHQLDVRLDGALLERFTVGGEPRGHSGVMNTFADYGHWGEPPQQDYELGADGRLEVRFKARGGARVIGVAFLKENTEQETERLPQQTLDEMVVSGYKGGEPAVDSVTISGPYQASGLSDTTSRRRIFVCTPGQGSAREEECARTILSALARRAYRRPVAAPDLDPLLEFYQHGREEGGFEAGIGRALERILVSPEFLFRIERDPLRVAPDTAYRITDVELASRLSFFLWSSIPDEELLTLAEKGTLGTPAVIEQQVRRMLADPRARALVTNFAGQWLSLRKLRTLSPDPKAFPDFDDNLREALREETELFVESLLRENRSVLDLLAADYTFLNERLARHYGIPGVLGSHFRRVSLADERRRGLLGHGSILTVTSYANRTAPTLRGAWILENLQGTPPPPPPPNVPSLREEEPGTQGRVLTMRERMEQHRVNPACATCHKVMDPLGFALENFDALGRWRDSYAGTPIDPSGVLPSGSEFAGPVGLRTVLLGNPEQFVHTFVEKLFTYGLGRGVEFYDAPSVRQVMREAAGERYRLGTILAGIAKSPPFQMRRSRPS